MSQKPSEAQRKGSSAWNVKYTGAGGGEPKKDPDKENKYITSPKTESNPESNACRWQRMPYGHDILHTHCDWMYFLLLIGPWKTELFSRHYLVERRNYPERFFESGTRLTFIADGKSYLSKFGRGLVCHYFDARQLRRPFEVPPPVDRICWTINPIN